MGPPGDPAGGRCAAEQRADAVVGLQGKPEHEEENRRHRQDGHDPGDERPDPRARKQNQVRAEHAGNRAAGADHRVRRSWLDEDLQPGGGKTGQQVEKRVAPGPEPVFHVSPKYPEKPDVAQHMPHASVEKHVGDQRAPLRTVLRVCEE